MKVKDLLNNKYSRTCLYDRKGFYIKDVDANDYLENDAEIIDREFSDEFDNGYIYWSEKRLIIYERGNK